MYRHLAAHFRAPAARLGAFPAMLHFGKTGAFLSAAVAYIRPYDPGTSWTTDAPYRETKTAIRTMREKAITCVEMEAAALYALSEVKRYPIVCFAHLSNTMAQRKGDFEKGEEFGSIDTLRLIRRWACRSDRRGGV